MDNRQFVAIDFETANACYASVCAIGMAKYDATGEKIEEYYSLVRPHAHCYYFSRKNIKLHGIKKATVKKAPEWFEIVDEIRHFIGDLPLVAHYISFDKNVMQRVMELYGLGKLPNDWLCTQRIAKKFFEEKDLPDLEKYWIGEQLLDEKALSDSKESRIDKQSSKEEGSPGLKESLESLKKWDREHGQELEEDEYRLFGLRNIYHYFSEGGIFKHHNASDDAKAAAFIFLKMREKCSDEDLKKYSEIKSRTNGKSKTKRPPKTQKSDSSSKKLDELKECYKDLEPTVLQGETICFTGELDAGDRETMECFAKNFGAKISKSVTRKTTVLVYGKFQRGEDSASKKKAETDSITILDEVRFFALLDSKKADSEKTKSSE